MRLVSLQHLRPFSSASESSEAVLARWLQEWEATPPVPSIAADSPPTALSWLRRRLSARLPESALRKLFRSETVRLFDPATGQVKRAASERPLPPGGRLLVPRSALPAASEEGGERDRQRQQRSPAASQQARAEWLRRLRASLLYQDEDLLAINKPAGLAVQGGSGVALSVDDLMGEAFGGSLPDAGAGLRLVHRLDRETSGLLLLARHADAAAWLGEAFRAGAMGEEGGRDGMGGGGRRRNSSGSSSALIRKMYLAVVECRGEAPHFRPEGSIDLPVAARSGSGRSSEALGAAAVPALTRYRGVEAGQGLAWLQLQPLTGRKHQLRLHCAQGLKAPILGDPLYGTNPRGRGPHPRHLFLHSRGLEIKRPGDARPLRLTAPLPDHWRALLQWAGWPLPHGEDKDELRR